MSPRRLFTLVPAGASAMLACAVGGGPAATRFHSPPDARSKREPLADSLERLRAPPGAISGK